MTTLVKPDYLRGKGFFDPEQHEFASYTQVGVGGIGSFAAFAIAKMGVPYLTLIDPDLVEPHNLPSQMFTTEDADSHKVDALQRHIGDVSDAEVWAMIARITAEGWQGDKPAQLRSIVGSGLDSMTARHDLWHQAVKLNPMVPMYIDARLDGQSVVIYNVNPCDFEDIEAYEATLKSDDEVAAGSCTERAIIDVGFTVGAQMARQVRRHYGDQPNDRITVIDAESNRVFSGGWLPS